MAGGSDGLARTLRLDDFPGDAAPRALALAGIEMLAALDPRVRARVEAKPLPASALAANDRFSLAVSAVRRSFFGTGGAAAWGGRAGVERRLGGWIVAADLEIDRGASTLAFGETRAWLASLGLFGGVVVAGGRFAGSLGAGARAGLARLSGDPAAGSGLVGQDVSRPWWGPALAATASVGGEGVAATALVEAGWIVRGAQGVAGGVTAIAIDGGWLMLGLGVRF